MKIYHKLGICAVLFIGGYALANANLTNNLLNIKGSQVSSVLIDDTNATDVDNDQDMSNQDSDTNQDMSNSDTNPDNGTADSDSDQDQSMDQNDDSDNDMTDSDGNGPDDSE